MLRNLQKLLSIPVLYEIVQVIMGAHSGRKYFATSHIKAKKGDFIIDFGCGTARILDYLPFVSYYGFDSSASYIQSAIMRYGKNESMNFECKTIGLDDVKYLESFDIALAVGVIHHLDDIQANYLVETACACLKKGGRFVTLDPVYTDQQNPIARYLINKDRGGYVRDEAAYSKIMRRHFSKINHVVKSSNWVPYTRIYYECIKS